MMLHESSPKMKYPHANFYMPIEAYKKIVKDKHTCRNNPIICHRGLRSNVD